MVDWSGSDEEFNNAISCAFSAQDGPLISVINCAFSAFNAIHCLLDEPVGLRAGEEFIFDLKKEDADPTLVAILAS